jgi:molecular chaperone GrpE
MAAEARAGGVPDPADRAGGAASGAESTADSASDGPAKVHGDPLRGKSAQMADSKPKHAAADPKHAAADPEHAVPAESDTDTAEGKPADGAEDRSVPFAAEVAALRTALDERTRDLQRITAEYANYRKRVDRDRALVVEQATGNVIAVLLPVLDDLDRAREHGDLTGPFAAVADQLTAALAKFGLTAFGAPGDPFDPTRHEAVTHRTSSEVTEPSCVSIMRRGYQLGERLLRPALVEVADPE